MHVVAYYNPPNTQLDGDLFKRLDLVHFVLIGDLNAKISKRKTRNAIGNQLLDIIENSNSSHLFYNYSPTYYSNKIISGKRCLYEETLDHLISSSTVVVSRFNVLSGAETHDSAHSGFHMKRTLLKTNWSLFKERMETNVTAVLKNNAVEELDVDSMYELLWWSAKTAKEESSTIITVNGTGRTCLPLRIRLKINERKNLKRQVKYDSAPELKKAFNRLTKEIKQDIDEFRSRPWQKLVDQTDKQLLHKRLWKRVNSIRNPAASSIPPLELNGIVYRTNKEKADLFASTLAETFSDSNDRTFNARFKSETDRLISQRVHDPNQQFELVCSKAVAEVIVTLDDEAASGPDKFDNRMLKQMRSRLS
jgi:hypothetical protein